jgi:predicted NACHT family NTPase
MSQSESFIDGAIDTVETTFTKGIAGTLFDIAKKVGGSTFQVIGDKRQAAQASKKYADRYQNRYGLLKLLGMNQGVALESVYTPVRVLNELSISQFETITDLEQGYRDSGQRRLQKGECRAEDGIIVANKNQYLMVLGNPGGGKSTFLRRLGLEALKGDAGSFQHKCIPVMLELKQFNSEQVDLISAIAEEFTHFGFPSTPEFTTKALESGKLLILLDGLDEIPNQFTNSVMNVIDNLVTKYEKNRFIASCRIAAYRSNFQHDFKVIELADFDDKQIQQFITNWFSTELDRQSQTAKKCWETLNDDSNQAAKELAQTPLLLTFLCLVYNRKQSFPPTRSRLYNKALDILLEEWAAEKRLNQEPIHEGGLHTDLEKVMLAEIAHEGFKDDQLFFDQNKIIKSITDFLADSVEKPKYLDGKKILNEIAAQQGILVQRAEEIYSFSHLTLQEYLTAQHINEDDSLVQQLISQHLTDRRWREVFLLVAGLKNDASKFLLAMEKATQELINTDKLHQLLVWAKDRTNKSPGDIQSAGRRALILANALVNTLANGRAKADAKANTLAKANAFAKAKANAFAKAKANDLAFAYACANSNVNDLALKYFIKYAEWSEEQEIYLDANYPQLISTLKEIEQKIPDNQEAEEVHKVFGETIIQIWLAAFHLQPEMVDLSIQEIQALDNYFYSNLLMVECEQAAVKVSRRTWLEIESRMLMPFREPS